MNYIEGESREQITLFPEAIEDYITEENVVRFIDAFVDGMDLQAMNFDHTELSETGRPPYNAKDLLKLYLYGYLNRIRSSRQLEKESKRNLEVMWLLKRLSPDHKTISNFRKKNVDEFKEVFKRFIVICKELKLFGEELIAIDSTKFKAQNSRDRVKDGEGIRKGVEKIEKQINEYIKQLDENDSKETTNQSMTKEEFQRRIKLLEGKREKFKEAGKQFEESQEKYVSLTDPDCRLIKDKHGIEPSYRVHAAVDSKHSLILEYEITNYAADNNHLSSIAIKTKEELGKEKITVCADAGYYDTVELKKCQDNGVNTYVAIPEPKISKKTATPSPEYYHDKFSYHKASDTYRCPQGNKLTYYTDTKKEDGRKIYIYRTKACAKCSTKNKCTTSPRGRYIYRWSEEEVIDELKQRLNKHPEIIKKRKAIIEHIFGIIKSVWGYGTLLMRQMKNIKAEIALMSLTYNIRRVITIVGVKRLTEHLNLA